MILLLGHLEELSELFAFPPGLLLLCEFGALMRMTLWHVTAQCLCLFKELVFANGASEELLASGNYRLLRCVHRSSVFIFIYIFRFGSYTIRWFLLQNNRFFLRRSWSQMRHLSNCCGRIRSARFVAERNLDLRWEGEIIRDFKIFVFFSRGRRIIVQKSTFLKLVFFTIDWTNI